MADSMNSPGERRLAHPPSDRYRTPDDVDLAPDSGRASPRGRGLAFGTLAGLAGAASITILGGVLTVTAGLLVVALVTGWAVGIGLSGRPRTAIALAVVAIALGQVGLWGLARSEGGVLGPFDLLWQVYGGLVPAELVAAAVAGWLAAR
jgi:hypothetical protein